VFRNFPLQDFVSVFESISEYLRIKCLLVSLFWIDNIAKMRRWSSFGTKVQKQPENYSRTGTQDAEKNTVILSLSK